MKGGKGQPELAERKQRSKDELRQISNGIDYTIFEEFKRVLKKINIFIWCSKLQVLDILNYFAKDNLFEILVWCKTNPTPTTNNIWLQDIEYCLYFREKGVRLNDGYDIKHKYYVMPINTYDKKRFTHPTIKPETIVKNHLLHATKLGDTILDPFCGSGTTLKVCDDIDRKAIGFEINKQYYEIVQNRINHQENSGQIYLF